MCDGSSSKRVCSRCARSSSKRGTDNLQRFMLECFGTECIASEADLGGATCRSAWREARWSRAGWPNGRRRCSGSEANCSKEKADPKKESDLELTPLGFATILYFFSKTRDHGTTGTLARHKQRYSCMIIMTNSFLHAITAHAIDSTRHGHLQDDHTQNYIVLPMQSQEGSSSYHSSCDAESSLGSRNL